MRKRVIFGVLCLFLPGCVAAARRECAIVREATEVHIAHRAAYDVVLLECQHGMSTAVLPVGSAPAVGEVVTVARRDGDIAVNRVGCTVGPGAPDFQADQ